MRYGFVVYKTEVEGREFWIAKSKDLEFCVGQGDTCDEAIRELEENESVWLEMAEENGEQIPTPSIEQELSYSGKFTVRLSKSLHERAAKKAEQEGISLNLLVAEAVAEKVAAIKPDHIREFTNALKKFREVVITTGGLIMNIQGIYRKGDPSWTQKSAKEEIKPGVQLFYGIN